MKVLVCGSRGWHDRDVIRRVLSDLPDNAAVVHGAAAGADSIAGEIAVELGIHVTGCPAEWNRFGKAAGIIRNRQMLDEHQPDLVLAFVKEWEKSPGTRNTVSIARKRGIETQIFDEDGQLRR